MKERWKPHPKYEAYLVSSLGRVARIKGKTRRYTKINGWGYGSVSLSHKGRQLHRLVHCLVAETFIGPRPEGYQINHKDGNKLNNAIENLEYVTPSENGFHAYRTGLKKPVRWNGDNPSAKLTVDQVKEIKTAILNGERGIQVKLARKYGVRTSTISAIKTGANWEWVLPKIPRHL